LGVQGRKRKKFAGGDYVGSIDPVGDEADYKNLRDVPLDRYDAVLACIPDEPKLDLVRTCIDNGKHVLVEKPLWTPRDEDISELERAARARGVLVYTAYNHRFEPHFVRMRDLIASGELGTIYSCRMFYGNGTARLVRDSEWRDQGRRRHP
jgi:predicted dehydrogenase